METDVHGHSNGGIGRHPRQTMALGQSGSDTIQVESNKASG